MEINQEQYIGDHVKEVAPGTRILLQNYACPCFSFAATMRLENPANVDHAAFGIVIQYRPKTRLYIQFQKRERWLLAVESVGMRPVINCAQTLADDFDPFVWQTLHIEQQTEKINIIHNGQLQFEVIESTHSSQPGLIIQHTRATFTGIVYAETPMHISLN